MYIRFFSFCKERYAYALFIYIKEGDFPFSRKHSGKEISVKCCSLVEICAHWVSNYSGKVPKAVLPSVLLTNPHHFVACGPAKRNFVAKVSQRTALPEVPHLSLVLRHLLCEWFAPSFIISNHAQRFAFLLTFPDGLSRVAERKDREDRDLLGYAQKAVDLRQVVEANPV